MNVSLEKIKRLREKTLAGVLDCKQALEETEGDFERAKRVLREKGAKIAEKKIGKKTTQGTIVAYIHHNGRVGAIAEIHCQSDFVARNAEFQKFAKDIAMHITAFNPKWISPQDIPESVIEEEKSIIKVQAEREGKPPKIMKKIVGGRIKAFYKEVCLLEQPFFKDEKMTVKDCLQRLVAKIGENVKVYRFARYELREESKDN
ncbi:MAG: translation elongation factor Ts [Candidatus Aerophobetes bacterium]|nr:translation elongation factor Ts [Candidatus Aerophobetes bacterium]